MCVCVCVCACACVCACVCVCVCVCVTVCVHYTSTYHNDWNPLNTKTSGVYIQYIYIITHFVSTAQVYNFTFCLESQDGGQSEDGCCSLPSSGGAEVIPS